MAPWALSVQVPFDVWQITEIPKLRGCETSSAMNPIRVWNRWGQKRWRALDPLWARQSFCTCDKEAHILLRTRNLACANSSSWNGSLSQFVKGVNPRLQPNFCHLYSIISNHVSTLRAPSLCCLENLKAFFSCSRSHEQYRHFSAWILFKNLAELRC